MMRKVITKYLDDIKELSENLDKENEFNEKQILDTVENLIEKLLNEIINPLSDSQNKSVFKINLLYHLLDEAGFKHSNKLIKANINKWQTEAKVRLFMMYVKVLHEIVYLLQGGFASAALARVRTIYEIVVFYEIISKNDDLLAEKFLKHSNTNRLKIAKSLSDQELKQKVKDQINEFQYGDEFLADYQWANSLFNKGRITFKDLADITELSDSYWLYVSCCSSVHANIYNSLCGLDIRKEERGKSIWITTPSDEGIDYVIRILLLCSTRIVMDFLEGEKLTTIFISCFYKNIVDSIKDND